MKIVHLFEHERGSRYHMMLNQGLIQDSRVERLYLQENAISLGQTWYVASTPQAIAEMIKQADVIFVPTPAHFRQSYWLRLIDDQKLWQRVVMYDFADWFSIEEKYVERCLLYVKRTPPADDSRDNRILYVGYGVLDEYVRPPTGNERDIDVLCLFHEALLGTRNPNEDSRRAILREVLIWKAERPDLTIMVGVQTTRSGRRAIFDAPQDNPFIEYLDLLARAKIVITPVPDHGGGDNRLWEAFASGALVVSNLQVREPHHGFVSGRHYIDTGSLMAIEPIKIYLDILLKDGGPRADIAFAGRQHALDNHRAVHRVGEILDQVERRLK